MRPANDTLINHIWRVWHALFISFLYRRVLVEGKWSRVSFLPNPSEMKRASKTNKNILTTKPILPLNNCTFRFSQHTTLISAPNPLSCSPPGTASDHSHWNMNSFLFELKTPMLGSSTLQYSYIQPPIPAVSVKYPRYRLLDTDSFFLLG